MEDVLAARSQMAFTLAFHIVFAVVGMAMPLLMVLAEWRWLVTRDEAYRDLARRWARGTGIMFAVGAVSGTVLSFELGLLFPRFMQVAGPVVGMPFSLEGFAFFTEAIFLGIYLYGFERVRPRVHLGAGVVVAISGCMSAVFVVTANAWMNAPVGFVLKDGHIADVDILAAMTNPAAAAEVVHMVLAAFVSVGFAVAGIHAWLHRARPAHESAMHRRAWALALGVGSVAMVLQMVSGHESATMVARTQPAKLAAMEGLWETQARAPLELGGWSSNASEETIGAIRIPYGLSILAYSDPDATVVGLKDVAVEDRPPSGVVHLAFDVMVGCATVLLGLAAWWAFLLVRRRSWWTNTAFARACTLAAPLGFVALQAGWVVTEVGRQPWVIQGVLRTADAATTMPGLWVTFGLFAALYAFLAATVVILMRVQVFGMEDAPTEGTKPS